MPDLLSNAGRIARAATREGMNPPVYTSIVYPLSIEGGGLVSGEPVSLLLLAFITAVLIIFAAATNLIDDYFDWLNRVDTPESTAGSYRKHPIFSMGIRPRDLFIYGLALIVFASLLVAGYSFLFRAPYLLLLIPAGAFIAYGYTGPPIGLKYRGISEVAIASTVLAVYYISLLSAGVGFSVAVTVFPIPVALILPVIILSGHLRDMDSDRKSGLVTLEVRLGRKGTLILAQILVFGFIALSGYVLFALWDTPLILIWLLPEIVLGFLLLTIIYRPPSIRIETQTGNIVFAEIITYFIASIAFFVIFR
ncbi:MAG: prenyltransferase [Thermoplasmataceae archaeon]